MNPTGPRRPATRADFEIAIICALTIEADVVDTLFDHHWDDDGIQPYEKAPSDPNAYSTGAIGRHNIVLIHMPGMGKVSAAVVAANCRASFPNIKLALIVGVCGVVPFRPDSSKTTEIVLGDVIVSDGVIEVFRGRRMLRSKMAGYMDVLQGEPELAAVYPGATQDRLYEATYRHVSDGMSCEECACDGKLVSRVRLEQSDGQPMVHFGLIASGDTVMKSGEDRDAIVRQTGVIGFEMESAGVWDVFPCVVIKGACDYADSHKTKTWQRYAAATAAACMKAFLCHWVPSMTGNVTPAIDGAALPSLYIPLPENRRFVGRDKTLDTLKDMLFVRKKWQKASIVGLGGIGKTQVALQLAYWTKKHRPEFSIFWVPALSNATFEQVFTAIARKLPIQTSGKDDDPKESVRRYLSSKAARPWLLVLDNADDILFGSTDIPGGISEYLPESDDGLTLFTTRSREVAVWVTGSDVIELHEMDPLEAADYLEKSLIQKDMVRDKAATAELLKQPTYLPLAITQAAAYINIKQVPLAKHLGLLYGSQKDLVSLMSKEFRDNTRYPGSQNLPRCTTAVTDSAGSAPTLARCFAGRDPVRVPGP
ncbi:nucleoside phosphorylase domain-containing protein [Corynascus similis CBS 632.67]